MDRRDVILILGVGILPDGSLPEIAKTWTKRGVELYQKGVAPRILISGAWSYQLDQRPSRTEAAAMKEYAVSLGVPESAIYTEEESKDTIGNLYFSKVNYLEPQDWRRVVVVCSDHRRERTGYLLKKILGPTYEFRFADEPSESSRADIEGLAKKKKPRWN